MILKVSSFRTIWIFLILFMTPYFAISQERSEPDSSAHENIGEQPKLKLYKSNLVIPSFPPIYFAGFRFKVDTLNWEKPKRIGVYGQNIKPYLMNNPESLEYLNKYRKLRKAGIYQFIAVPIIMFSAIIIGSNYSNRTNELPPSYVDAMVISGGIIYLSGTITFSFVAPSKLKKAVNIANRMSR